jgi:hypothetical protein
MLPRRARRPDPMLASFASFQTLHIGRRGMHVSTSSQRKPLGFRSFVDRPWRDFYNRSAFLTREQPCPRVAC